MRKNVTGRSLNELIELRERFANGVLFGIFETHFCEQQFYVMFRKTILSCPCVEIYAMWTLAQQTLSKLKRMTDSDYDSQKFYFTDENE